MEPRFGHDLGPDFSPRVWKGGAEQAAEKRPRADNHPGARRATPPESGGELPKMLPSSDEEGGRAVPQRESGTPAARRRAVVKNLLRCHFATDARRTCLVTRGFQRRRLCHEGLGIAGIYLARRVELFRRLCRLA